MEVMRGTIDQFIAIIVIVACVLLILSGRDSGFKVLLGLAIAWLVASVYITARKKVDK
ncbi:hypothetical protein ES708_17746 [subsurface metagenome]